jgi:hypothetical protein
MQHQKTYAKQPARAAACLQLGKLRGMASHTHGIPLHGILNAEPEVSLACDTL